MIDGRRIWLVGGALPYFRVPPELWRDRLVKARAAGLNCIFSPVPWNMHERREGQWDFAAGLDVAAFVRLAGELGLYVALGVGPYVGADCDMGGLPSWLTARSGVTLRSSGASFIHYFDKFFRQLLPRLADLQVTRNGTLLLLQAEHHYTQGVMPDRQEYLQFIMQLIRRGGMDIPVITDNLLSDPPAPDALETARFTGQLSVLYRLRARQPKAPLMVSELTTGQGSCWGKPHASLPAAEIARRAAQVLGCGCPFIYDPWHGGTNFGFAGAQLPVGPDSFTTTGRGGPILGEGGELTDAFYATRIVNLLAQTLGPQIAQAQWEPAGMLADGTRALNLSGPTGRWVTVLADDMGASSGMGVSPVDSGKGHGSAAHPPARASRSAKAAHANIEPPPTFRVLLPTGRELDVPMGKTGWAILPVGALLAGITVDYCNLTPLGFFGDKLLILHGPAGAEGVISIDGVVQQTTVPADDKVVLLEGDLHMAVINTELASRTWPVEGGLLLGPTFVGDGEQNIHLPPHAKDYQLLTHEGKLTVRKTGIVNGAAKQPAPPKLSNPKLISGCAELSAAATWTRCPGPQSVDALGQCTGYVWYRVEITSDKPAKHNLLLPQARDRVSLFLNGKPVGTVGVGAGATAEPLTLSLPKGQSVLTAMVDNLGRIVESSRLGDPKGLFGHLYDAKSATPSSIKPRPVQEQAAKLLPRAVSHLAPML